MPELAVASVPSGSPPSRSGVPRCPCASPPRATRTCSRRCRTSRGLETPAASGRRPKGRPRRRTGEEDVIVGRIDDGREIAIDRYRALPRSQRRPSKVLEPAFRALHAIEPAMRAVGMRHRRALGAARDGQTALNLHVSEERAGGGARDAVGGAHDPCCPGSAAVADHRMSLVRNTIDSETTGSRRRACVRRCVARVERQAVRTGP